MRQQHDREQSGGWIGNIWRQYQARKRVDEDIRLATERVVDIADPYIRQAGGYRKVLRMPVAGAQHYCASLIDAVPGPVVLSRDQYNDDPLVKAVFVSADQLEELLRIHPEVRALRQEGYMGQVVALMTMLVEEKTIFGYQKEGEMIMRDVAQRAVTFYDHRIVAPSTDIAVTRHGIVNRGLEVLAHVAMERIATLQGRKAELHQKKEYLKAALKILGGKTHVIEMFATPEPEKREEYRKAEQLLADVEKELAELAKIIGYPEQSLGYLDGVLRKPEASLVVDRQTMRLNWANVRVDNQPDSEGNDITLAEFSIPEVLTRLAMLVTFPVGAMPSI